jgi:hypothetical protein
MHFREVRAIAHPIAAHGNRDSLPQALTPPENFDVIWSLVPCVAQIHPAMR